MPSLASLSITHELLRYLVVIVTIPLWLPFVRALWKELNRSLRWEGGLLGRAPTSQEREELLLRTLEEEDPLVHEPLAGPRSGRGGFRSASAEQRPGGPRPGGPRPGATAGRRPAPGSRPGPRRSGFR